MKNIETLIKININKYYERLKFLSIFYKLNGFYNLIISRLNI